MSPCGSGIGDSSVGHLVVRTVGESSALPMFPLHRCGLLCGPLAPREKRSGSTHANNSHKELLGRTYVNNEHLQVDVSILSTRVGEERRHQGATTVPCNGVRARERHHIITHGSSGEFGTDVAISAQPRHAHGQVPVVGADDPNLGEERVKPCVSKDGTRCPCRTRENVEDEKLQRKTRDKPSR